MIVDKKTELVEAEVDFLHDLDVTWVSLVAHGANRLPFKIIKSALDIDGDSEVRMFDVIHSIIVPKNTDIEVLKNENPWMNGITFSSTEDFDEYKKFVQVPSAQFVEGSIELRKMDNGVMLLVGKVENPDPSWVSMYQEDAVSKEQDEDGIDYAYAFKNAFVGEVNNLINILVGALDQSELSPKKKKSVISSAMDAFKVFIMAGIDNGGMNMAVKADIPKFELEQQIGEEIMGTMDVEVQATQKDETLEKLDLFISKVDSLIEKLDARTAVEEVEKKEVEVVEEQTDTFSKFDDRINAMQQMIEKLVEKVESMDDTFPEPVTKSEDYVDPVQTDPQDIWVGSIFKQ